MNPKTNIFWTAGRLFGAICALLVAFFFLGWPILDHALHPGDDAYYALINAIDSGNLAAVQKGLKPEVDPNYIASSEDCDEENYSPLYEAADKGNITIVRLLLAHGAKINGDDSPLSAAASNGHLDVMRLLIERGAIINETSTGSNALWNAAISGQYAATEMLLQHGANPNSYTIDDSHKLRLIDDIQTSDDSHRGDIIRLLKRYGAAK